MALQDETQWQTVYNGFHASPDPKSSISTITIPGFFTQHIIRVYSNSLQAKPHWRFGGQLIHIIGDSAPNFEVSPRQPVFLKTRTLIQLPQLTNEYRLKFEPARWHRELAVVIEVYTGQ